MREIKFRGFALETQTWVYGYFFKEAIADEDSDAFKHRCFIRAVYGDHYMDYEVDEKTVSQYTGLKDKNGKEIYEGDIVRKYHKSQRKDDGRISELEAIAIISWGKYSDDEYGWTIECWLSNNSLLTDEANTKDSNPYWDCLEERYEIIGNIYENPNLLTENELL